MDGLYALQAPFASADGTLPTLLRDPLLSAPNSGVRFLADLAFGFCYPGGPFTGRGAAAAPINGSSIYDIAELANGSFNLVAGQAMTYAGGGFDFSGLTNRGSYLAVPAAVANDIYTAFGGASQRFLACAYVKLPSQADWNTSASVAPFFSWASANAAPGVPDIVSMGQGQAGTMIAVRQTGGATLVTTQFNVPVAAYGQLAQVAFWRNAAGVGMSLKTAASGRTSQAGAVGADNAENFSAQVGRMGVGNAYWSTPLSVPHLTAAKFRLYRCFVENLARSGRDPLTVLDADWDRVVARNAFT